MVVGLERWAQVCHFIDNYAEGPYITLFVVALFIALLWTHIEWTPYICLGKVLLAAQRLRQAEVSELHILFFIKENIGWLQISVQN